MLSSTIEYSPFMRHFKTFYNFHVDCRENYNYFPFLFLCLSRFHRKVLLTLCVLVEVEANIHYLFQSLVISITLNYLLRRSNLKQYKLRKRRRSTHPRTKNPCSDAGGQPAHFMSRLAKAHCVLSLHKTR